MNSIEAYIKKGYEVMNALIEYTDITTEEYPTVNIQLKLPCGGVIFGGYAFAKRVDGDFKLDGWEKGMTATCIDKYDTLVFTLGYPKADDAERRLTFKNPKIRIGTGKPEWGAEPDKLYFVITWEE